MLETLVVKEDSCSLFYEIDGGLGTNVLREERSGKDKWLGRGTKSVAPVPSVATSFNFGARRRVRGVGAVPKVVGAHVRQ